ncbi:MAG: hypothetical protein FDZ70_09620, partial [Actinobacteria bacterium]
PCAAPNPAELGTAVTVSGTSFGAAQGASTVAFDGIAAVVTAWSDTAITAIAPGDGPVVVTCDGIASNAAAFSAYVAPVIAAVDPAPAEVGTVVTISGTAFGAAQGLSTVTFNGVPATVVSWSDTAVSALVPGDGPVVVTVDGHASNAFAFAAYSSPVIGSVSPASARAGTAVTISGTDFGAAQGASTVTFNGVPATVVSWSDTAIDVTVPCEGPVVVTVGGHASNAFAFAVLPAPAITAVDPDPAEVGTDVTISGTDFGAAQGASTVTFNGVPATVVSWSDTAIVVTVPCDGPVVVTCDGAASNAVAFDSFIRPHVTSLSKDYAIIGETITITGERFGSVPGKVTIAGRLYDAASWSDTQVTFVVPGFAQGYVGVLVDGVVSNGVWSTHAPRVDSISPGWAAVGTDVTIRGVGFGPNGSGWVALAGKPVTVVSWTDTVVVARMPTGATSGYLGVVRGAWATSNGKYLGIMIPATVTSVSATTLTPGQQITVTGTNFGGPQATSQVKIGTAVCPVVTWTNTSITVTVPSFTGAQYLGVYLQGCPSNGILVTRSTASPTVASLSRPWANPGEQVTIYGHGFAGAQGSGFASISGVRATVVSWSDTEVTVIVPAGANAGYAGIFQNGLSSNGACFVPFEPPVISSLSTASAAVGERVTVSGTAFGSSPGVLTLAGTTVAAVSWSDTQIEFDVPAGAVSGYVGVTKSGSTSNGKWLVVK